MRRRAGRPRCTHAAQRDAGGNALLDGRQWADGASRVAWGIEGTVKLDLAGVHWN